MVGQFYRDFAQTSDDQVVDLLDDAAARLALAGRSIVGTDGGTGCKVVGSRSHQPFSSR